MSESISEDRYDGASEPVQSPDTTPANPVPERWPGTPVHEVPPEDAAEGGYDEQVRRLKTEPGETSKE